MATKRGKALQAKALGRRATKKLKRHVRRHGARVAFMATDIAVRARAEREAREAAQVAAYEAARQQIVGAA